MDLSGIRIIDAHIHQWDPFTTPRVFSGTAKLLKRVPLPMGLAKRLAPRRDREFIGDPTAYTRPYLPADYRADAGGEPIDAIVHIEVGWVGKDPLAEADETAWVARLPFGGDNPELGAILGCADPAALEFAALLDAHLAAAPLLRGIRSHSAHHPDPGVRPYADHAGALAAKEFLSGFERLAERDLSFEAWVYSHAIPDVTALAERYPEVPIVLNHLGTPAGLFGPIGKRTGADPGQRRALSQRWRDDLAALAEQPNVVAKVSGLMMPVLGHPVPPRGTSTPVPVLVDRVRPLVEHALDVFGADRLIWGSNFPVDKPITSIADSIEVIATVITDHGGGPRELARIFRDNARRVYRIDHPAWRFECCEADVAVVDKTTDLAPN
ncbi:putative TIM-barrel fold metal-dependent hydrolase [Nocardia tenerifensis]|uniref:Putative TIM-barrel fold metal-dependent hydrolase n=1 Tax=Nocardia tenerifensis TaxID=228006 RepID=A0A318K3U9_9NOCA|nr:amidohydrolase family protein [Nocardia tenerifensis]PXX66309.1 putative TIM-barrel fold metal-dependent hydrolase [Nocardia tenerifensis]